MFTIFTHSCWEQTSEKKSKARKSVENFGKVGNLTLGNMLCIIKSLTERGIILLC